MASLMSPPYFSVGAGLTTADGALLNFFVVGSGTRKNTFTTAAATTAHANPVVADALGVFPAIYLSGNYDWTLQDKNAVQRNSGSVSETATATSSAFIKNFATLAAAVANTNLVDGDALNIAEHTTGNGGGAAWDVVLLSAVTVNSVNIWAWSGNTGAASDLALKLRVSGLLDPKQAGIVQGADITAAFQALQDALYKLRMEGGTYTISSPIVMKADFQAYNGRVSFDANGLAAATVGVLCTVEVDIVGLDVDGANTATMTAGFQHTLEFTPTRTLLSDVRSFNITNTDNTLPCYGVLYVVGSGASNTSIDLESRAQGHNITATANATVGDTGGKSAGVHLSVNKAGMTNKVTFIEPKASKIYPNEDGDGIHIFDTDSGNLVSESIYFLIRPEVSDCAKRGIKSQGPNIITVDPIINVDLISGASTSANAYQCLGVNNSLINPVVIGTNTTHSDGSISVSASKFTLRNPIINVIGGQNLIRFETGATNYIATGVSIDNEDNYANVDFSMILLEGGASGYLEIDHIVNTNKTGSAVRYLAVTGDNTLKINSVGQAAHLVRYGFCSGDFVIESAYGDVSADILREDGDSGTYLVKHCDSITSGASAITSDAAMKLIGSGRLQSTTNGLLYTAGVSITGREVSGSWKISATGVNSEVITAITAANPAVVTITGHSFTNGQLVRLTGIGGMIELNDRVFTVASAAANTFQLSGINSTSFTSYTSGGTASLISGKAIDAGSSKASRFTGVQTEGFATHINANFSDRCVITNNIARGAGTHVSATSATNIINRDNDQIL
jgi:hypothetical protein